MPETPETTMGRLDERLKGLEKKTDEHHNTVMLELKDIKENINPRLLSLENRIYTKSDFSEFYKQYVEILDTKVNKDDFKQYVDTLDKKANKDEFNLVKGIVYGAVAIILVAVFSSIVYLVINRS